MLSLVERIRPRREIASFALGSSKDSTLVGGCRCFGSTESERGRGRGREVDTESVFSGFLGFLGIYMVVKGCDGSGGAEAEF